MATVSPLTSIDILSDENGKWNMEYVRSWKTEKSNGKGERGKGKLFDGSGRYLLYSVPDLEMKPVSCSVSN